MQYFRIVYFKINAKSFNSALILVKKLLSLKVFMCGIFSINLQ